MIQISSLVQNNISNSISNSYCGNNSQTITCNYNNLANNEYYSIKGLNCIFNNLQELSGGKNCSPYIVFKVNNDLIISSVCKLLNDQAFWSDCLQFRFDGDQSQKLVSVEVHNYSLYQTEQDLIDPEFGDDDFLGSGAVDFSDLLAQRQPQKIQMNNSNISFNINQNEARSSQTTNATISMLSHSNTSNNLPQNNSVFIGQIKIFGKDGTNIGSLQFNIQKEIYSGHFVNSMPMISSTQIATMQQQEERENLKSITAKFSEILPQNKKSLQILQHSQSLPVQESSNSYFQSQSIYNQHDFQAENEYQSFKHISTPKSSKHQVYQNNQNKLTITSNPFIFNPIKSTIQEDDISASLNNIGLNENHFNLENNQLSNYQSYNAINDEDLNSFNNNSNPSAFQEIEDQISYHSSSENAFQQLSNSNHQIQPFCYPQKLPLQSIQNQLRKEFTVSPIRDIKGKINDIGSFQNSKPYIGLQNQYGKQIVYPSVQQQQQSIGLINMHNIPFQSIGGSAQTISTCSQKNQMNQISYQNFSQAVTVLGQNSMNLVQNPSQHLSIQNNLVRTAQSQKTIVNKCHQNNTSTISPIIQPAFIQLQNNNMNQPIIAPTGSFQKVNLSIASTRQPISVVATPFKNQRNGQNYYQAY